MKTILTLSLLIFVAGVAHADPKCNPKPAPPPFAVCQPTELQLIPIPVAEPAPEPEFVDLESDAPVFARCYTNGQLVLAEEGIRYNPRGRRLTQANRRVIYLPEGCTVVDLTKVR